MHLLAVLSALHIIFSGFSHAADSPNEEIGSYNKAKILLSRFKNKDRQDLFNKALTVRETVAKYVVGQDALAMAIQVRLIQYLNSVGTRLEEPVSMHMIGLPGVGKTSLIKALEELGIPVVKINAEQFPGG